MTRPLQLLTLLSLTTALLSAAPAQAGFEFVSKATPKPAATVATPTPAALVPVTNTTPTPHATPTAATPVWTAKAPSPTPAAIPLTPVVSASDSLQVIDAPLIPDMDDEIVAAPAPMIAPAPAPIIAPPPVAAVPAPVRQTLASQSSENVTTSVPAAPVTSKKRNSVLWDKPLAEIEKPLPLSAMTTSRTGDSFATPSTNTKAAKPAPAPLPLPEEIIETKSFDQPPVITTSSPEPIVETILDTPQAPVAFAPNDDAVVEGFGSGLPMVMALRQIVPPHYRFSFGPNVDPGQRVNWQGGKKWSEIVAELAQKNGLQSEIAGNVVAIRRAGTNTTASVASNNMMEDVVMGDSPLNAPVLPAPIVTPTRTTLSSSNTASKPLPIISTAKAPAEKAPISLLATPDDIASEKMPVVNRAIDVSPPQKDIVKSDKALPAPAKSELLPPITEETTILADPLPTPAEIKKDEAKKADVSANLTMKQEWVANSGKTLRSVLQDWSKEANVSLVWSSDFDYPLQTDLRIQGTYAEAVRTLLAGFGKAQPKPTGRLHKNAGVGAQPVLIIDTPRLINNG